MKYSLVTTTFPDTEQARKTAKLLIEKRLAACVQMYPVNSMYRWQGKITEESEVMLFIKSKTSQFDDISALIRENHSAEVPEIVQMHISDGLPSYLEWVDVCTDTTD